MGKEGDSLRKWTDFHLPGARDLDLGSGHTTYRHHSLTSIYTTNFIEIGNSGITTVVTANLKVTRHKN